MTKRLLVFLLFVSTFQYTYSISCLQGWRYNRSITVTNSNASAYTNQPVKITVNTSALIASGKMLNTGNDIRFTDGSCNLLHYWIDSNFNSTTTVIWVKVKSIPASGSTTIYMYYGNNCATSYQNGDSTFLLFDDFTAGTLNSGKWTNYSTTPLSTSMSFSGGRITLATTGITDNILRSNATYTSPMVVESKITANTGSFPSIALLNNGTFNGVTTYTSAGTNTFHTIQASASGSSYTAAANSSGVARANGFWKLFWSATNTATATFPNGTTQNAGTTPALSGSNHVAFGIYNNGIGSMSVDWIRGRLYVPIEFSSTVNTETAQSLNVSFTPTAMCPGRTITISFAKSGIFFGTGNIFKVELSDTSGSFATPYTLATINDTVLNTQIIELPIGTLPSNKYKVRVTSTNPSFTCFVSDLTLTVYPKPNVGYTVLNNNQCYKYNNYNFVSTTTISSGTITQYVWDWDDNSYNDTTTSTTISHKFKPFYPYYYPKLKARSNLGCTDSTSVQVDIRETPDIKTSFSDTIQCLRGNFFIIKSETAPISATVTSMSFLIGDGTPLITNVDSFSHTFAAKGIYNIRQINTLSNGCIDTNFTACLVNEHPIAQINTNDTDQCLTDNRFIFESQSTIGNGLPLLNYWSLGSGFTRDNQDSAQQTYTTASNRIVRLITISDDGIDGCSDTAYQTILVNPMPKAILTSVTPEQCFKNNSFKFIAKSTLSSGTMIHNWNFGDGNSINNDDTVFHTYTADGVFTTKLYTVSNKGCVDSTSTIVTIRPTPVPLFTFNNKNQCFKYHEFKGYSNSTISSGTFTKTWLLSDGADYTNVDSITHVFNSYGNYGIKLALNSNYNCKDTLSDSLRVLPMPVSDFIVNNADQCLYGNSFTFTDQSFFNQGNITGNKWLYDDGGSVLNQNTVTHSYIADAAYKPGLIVYGDNGCFDTSFNPIKVYPHPGSDFIINDTGQCVNNNSFQFLSNTFISEGGFNNRWYFGDGSPFVSTLNATKKYAKDSTYIVKLVSFSSDLNCKDSIVKTVTVFPKAKTNFTINNAQQCVLGNSFSFASTTTLKRGTFTTNWAMGDGNIYNNTSSVTHKYNNVSTYNVRLISLTNEGCYDTLIKPVRTLPMPVADYTFNYNKSCLTGNDFQFSATTTVSNNTPMNHNWYYSNGDSAINFVYTTKNFTAAGQYNVRLISSTNIGGCKDTIDKLFDVFPMPTASFLIDNDKQCFLNNSFGFTSTSSIASGTVDLTDWTFGDNTTSSIPNPFKSYVKVDSFRVKLTVTSNNGCIDTVARRVWVYPMPNAAFTVNKKSSCFLKNSFNFTNKATIGNGGTIATYQYYFDALNPATTDSSLVPSPTAYSYPASGSYVVLQKVTTDKGCWDTATLSIQVNPNPNLDFSVDSVCLKDSSIFINNSTIAAGGQITSWKWLFGDGKISTLQSPKHKYKNTGIYDITLIANTNLNCVDTLKKLKFAKVNPNPLAGFYYTKERSWENEVDIQYHDTSIGAISWKWNFGPMGTSTDQNPKLYYVDTLTQITSLIVTNIFGCRDTVTKSLFILPDVIYYMPSAFTPNDDNINETFKPVGLAFAQDYQFIVFNRWGDILFKTSNPQQGWDGKYQNALVPQDLYFYRLEFIGADEVRHEEKGNVMILR